MKGILLGISLLLTTLALAKAIPLPEPNPSPNFAFLYYLFPFEIFNPNPKEKEVNNELEDTGEITAIVFPDVVEPKPALIMVPAIAPNAVSAPEEVKSEEDQSKVAEAEGADVPVIITIENGDQKVVVEEAAGEGDSVDLVAIDDNKIVFLEEEAKDAENIVAEA